MHMPSWPNTSGDIRGCSLHTGEAQLTAVPRDAPQKPTVALSALGSAFDFLPSSKAEAKAQESQIAAQQEEITELKAQGATQAADIAALQQQIKLLNTTVPFNLSSSKRVQTT